MAAVTSLQHAQNASCKLALVALFRRRPCELRLANWYWSPTQGPTSYAAVSQGARLASATGASSRPLLTNSPPSAADLPDAVRALGHRPAPNAESCAVPEL